MAEQPEQITCHVCNAVYEVTAKGGSDFLEHPKNGCPQAGTIVYLKCQGCGLPVDDCECDNEDWVPCA